MQKKKKKELFSFPLGLLHFPFEPSDIHHDIYWLQAVKFESNCSVSDHWTFSMMNM